jgi:hypothetical protein
VTRRRVLRCATALADRAEQQIRAAGRAVPDRDFLLAALMPAARSAAASARFLERSARQLEVAEKWVGKAADAAIAAADRTASAWIESAEPVLEHAELTPGEETEFAGITAALQAGAGMTPADPGKAGEPR